MIASRSATGKRSRIQMICLSDDQVIAAFIFDVSDMAAVVATSFFMESVRFLNSESSVAEATSKLLMNSPPIFHEGLGGFDHFIEWVIRHFSLLCNDGADGGRTRARGRR
jgi:hypothetical protein